MTQPIYEFVMENLEATKPTWKAVASGSGVPYSTLYKIGARIVKDPGVSHIEKLATYFRNHPADKAA